MNLHQEILTESLSIRLPFANNAPEISSYYLRNKEHFSSYAPGSSPYTPTTTEALKRVLEIEQELRDKKSFRTFLFLKDSKDIIGHLSLTNITFGPLMGANLGFGLDCEFVGRGLMSEALGSFLPFAMNTIPLHRIMAAYLPTNERSRNTLSRAGFLEEGYAKEYLFINGEWRDHVLTSLINKTHISPSNI